MALSKIKSDSLSDNAAAGHTNLIINPCMTIAQRGTSSTSAGFQTVDRFEHNRNNTDQLATTQSQSTTTPDGFANSYKIVATTAETAVAADERARIRQNVEAQNLQHLKFGTSSAEYLTLSFWVRSDVTGTYAVNILGDDASRQIGSTYTINTADTWEHKVITFAGDTGSHTIANDNGVGFTVSWYLMAGSNYTATDNTSWGASATGKEAYGHTATWGETANDEWYITGVKLEAGQDATPLDALDHNYAHQVQMCKRYFHRFNEDSAGPALAAGFMYSATNAYYPFLFPVEMRATPTFSKADSMKYYYETGGNGAANNVTAFGADNIHKKSARLNVTKTSGHGSVGQASWIQLTGSGAHISFDAEL